MEKNVKIALSRLLMILFFALASVLTANFNLKGLAVAPFKKGSAGCLGPPRYSGDQTPRRELPGGPLRRAETTRGPGAGTDDEARSAPAGRALRGPGHPFARKAQKRAPGNPGTVPCPNDHDYP